MTIPKDKGLSFMDKTVIIRDMTEGDIDRVCELEAACFSTPFTKKAITELFSNTSWHFFVAECDGIVAGYISMYVIIDEKEIVNVCTDPEYRGLGIGSKLVCAAIEYEKEKCNTVMLEVRRSNSVAIALYEKFGFISVGVSKNHYSCPREDAILMNLEINKTEK